MNLHDLFLKIIFSVWMVLNINLAEAQKPVWTFEALSSPKVSVAANETVMVQYKVVNQSRKQHHLVFQATPGITQVIGNGYCSNPFTLDYKEPCTLTLAIQGANLPGNVSGGPVVCEGGNPNECYQPDLPDQLSITKNPANNYTVGGNTFGLSGTLVLVNNGGDALTINADGTFVFSDALPPGSTYSVSVQNQPATQTCTVSNGSGTITNTNITNITVNCSTNTRTLGGNVSGLAISESVVLQNNGSDTLTITSNGSFTFPTPVAQGSTYNVTVLSQPATQTCTVTNGSGTVGAIDITNVQITCAVNTFTVGGTVSGLSGSVVLQNNGGDDLTIISNGSFTFPTPVAEGATYNVTVLTQPTNQTCTVTNGSGTMGGANVTNVGVNCVFNATTLTTSISNLALSVTGITEYGISGTPSSGLARIITITNTGSNSAINLVVTPPAWPSGTTNTTTCGSILAAGNSCTITVTPGATATSDGTNPCSSGTAPVPGVVQVGAVNSNIVSTNVLILSYGCIYQGGYVYAFDDTTSNTASVGGKVVSTSDQASPFPNGIVWSSNGGNGGGSGGINFVNTSYDLIPGVASGSTSSTGSPTYAAFTTFFASTYTNTNPFTSASFSLCNGTTDGVCNTGNIVTFYNQFITNNTQANGGTPPFTATAGPTNITYYASGSCKQTIASFSDWYLTAICEMGYGPNYGCGSLAAPTLQNIQASLIDISGLSTLSGSYWSSTEGSSNALNSALAQNFSASSTQFEYGKIGMHGVRCSRVLTP